MAHIESRSSSRAKSPVKKTISRAIAKSPVKLKEYSFPINQVKKMIGKKLIVIHPFINILRTHRDMAETIKEKFNVEKNKKKSMVMFAMYNNGIWQVYKNIEIFIAITYISYKDMENTNISVTINECPKISRSELQKLL